MAQVSSTASGQESQTNIYPNQGQINLWQNMLGTAGGLAQYDINNFPPDATVADPTGLTNQYWQQAGASGTTGEPDMAGYTGQMENLAGWMNNLQAPTSYNIAPGQANLPSTYAGGTPSVGTNFNYSPMQVSGPTVSATQVQAPGAVNPITGIAQVQAPQLQNYQMSGVANVTAPNLQQFQMQAAAPVTAGQTTMPQSWTDPGTASQYMSPYTQQVVNTQLAQAQVQNQQQLNQIKGQAAQAGAFGGSREAIEEANQNLGYQQMAASLEAQGLQSAYQSGQQQFNTQQQAQQQAQQFNVQSGLQAALANQQAQQQANVQNLSSFLQTQGLGAQTGLQSQLANQQAGLTVGQQNLAANLQTQQLGATTGLQAALANQSMNYQTQLANQQAQEFGYGQQMQAGLANQQANLQAAMATAGYNMQGQLANQASGLQAGLTNEQLGLQAGEANQAAEMQALAQQYSGGLQSALQTQQLGMQGQIYGAQLGMQGTQLDTSNLMNQAALFQNAGTLDLAGYNAGLSGLGALSTAAQGQQGYEQQISDTNYQNLLNRMQMPWQGLEAEAGIAAESPSWGQTTTSDVYNQSQTDQPTFNLGQLVGGALSAGAQLGSAAIMAAKGGLHSIDDEGESHFDAGGIAALDPSHERASQFRRKLYAPLRTMRKHNYPAARKSPQRFLDQVLSPESTGIGNIAYA